MSLPVALQLYSVRDVLDRDFKGTISRVAQMGYGGVELSGFPEGMSAVEVRKILDDFGLPAISVHCPFSEMKQSPSEVAQKAKICGCRYVVIPWMDVKGYAPDVIDQTIAEIERLGEEIKKNGLTLLYHNHDFEFAKIDGEYVLDILYCRISDQLLQTQLDTCWVRVAGEDPAAYVKKYSKRAPLVHLKDFSGTRNRAMYELIGKKTEKAAQDSGQDFQFRPLGSGRQDIPAILRAAEEAGTEWVIVEQDKSVDMPTLEAAEVSIRYLKSLGW